MAHYTKNGGVWKPVDRPHVKAGGLWKAPQAAYVKDTVWKQFHQGRVEVYNSGAFVISSDPKDPQTFTNVAVASPAPGRELFVPFYSYNQPSLPGYANFNSAPMTVEALIDGYNPFNICMLRIRESNATTATIQVGNYAEQVECGLLFPFSVLNRVSTDGPHRTAFANASSGTSFNTSIEVPAYGFALAVCLTYFNYDTAPMTGPAGWAQLASVNDETTGQPDDRAWCYVNETGAPVTASFSASWTGNSFGTAVIWSYDP